MKRWLQLADWSMRRKLLASLGLLGALALAVGWAGLQAVERLKAELAAVQQEMEALDLVLQADRDAYQALSAFYALLSTDPNNRTRYEELVRFMDENLAQAVERATKAQELLSNEQNRLLAAGFASGVRTWGDEIRSIRGEVASASRQVATTSDQVARGAGEIARAVQEVASGAPQR